MGTAPTSVVLLAGETEASLELATEDDTKTETNGTISVTVQDDTHYNVASGGGASTSVTIVDNDGTNVLPIISIAADSVQSITEGSTANFTITSDEIITATSGLDVNLSITQGTSNFIDGTPATSVNIPQNANSIPLQVPTLADTDEEADGRIYVRVLGDNTPNDINYVVNSGQSSAGVTVWDDEGEAPVSVGVYTSSSTIQEGHAILFHVNASASVTGDDLQVNVDVSQTGDFILGAFGPRVIAIPAGQNSGNFTINTHDDIIAETGSITVTTLFGAGYRINNDHRFKTVTVTDNDTITGIPVLSIVAGSRLPISEADKAEFVISASIAPTNKLTVGIATSDGTGDFLATNQPRTIEFPDGESTYTHIVALDDDSQYEVDGQVTLTLMDHTDPSNASYAVAASPANKASISIYDNDPKPVISVSALSPIVVEGLPVIQGQPAPPQQTAQFLFSSTSAISDQQSKVKLSLGGDLNEFVDGDALFNQFKAIYIAEELGGDANSYVEATHDSLVVANGLFVEFAANATTAILTIPLIDDDMVEPDGNVTIAILTGDNYDVDVGFDSASVQVRDNDIPTLSIAGGNAVTEGAMAKFDLTMNPPPAAPVIVNVLLSQTGQFIAIDPNDQSTYVKQVQIATNGTGTLSVTTNDDNQDEHNGQVTATLYRDPQIPPRYSIAFSIFSLSNNQ